MITTSAVRMKFNSESEHCSASRHERRQWQLLI
jgi:hypothetical protein